MILNTKDIEGLERFYRRNLMNQLSGVKGANLIGTINDKCESNLAIFNSVFHLGANPACMGFIMRPLTVTRHTYENIKATKFYTINAVVAEKYKQAHHTGAKWEGSEFEACGFEPFYTKTVKAPYVKSSPMKIGLEYVEEHNICNGTVMMVGKVVELIVDDTLVNPQGYFDFEKANLLNVAGLDSYYTSQAVDVLDYPRPAIEVSSLNTKS